MQVTPSRRTSRSDRFPTRVAVEFGQGELHEQFEADVLDFTRAGVSMRAPYLPEIGTRLACRFRCLPSGSIVTAPGEVVWAQLEGESSGEFGLAFVDLDARTEWLIEEMLAEPIVARGEQRAAVDPLTELELEGSAEPIAARLARHESGVAVFEQHLDLLSLGRGVRAHAPGARDRSGSIAGVELRMVGNVPMLAVTVDFERESTLSGIDGVDLNLPHDTVQDMAAPSRAEPETLDESESRSITLTEFGIAEHEAPRRGAPARKARPATYDARESPAEFALAAVGDAGGDESLEPDQLVGHAWQAEWLDRLDLLGAKIAAWFEPLKASAGAILRDGLLRWEQTRGRAGTALRDRFHLELGNRVGSARRLLFHRRRTTAAPGAPRRATASVSGGMVALCVAGALLAGVGVYLLASRPHVPRTKPAQLEEPALGEAAVDAPALGANGSAAASLERSAASSRRRLSASPSDELGAATADGVAVSSPFAVDVRGESREPAVKPTFGAASKPPRAKRFALRMNAPVRSLQGVDDPSGFTVTIPGALALDRAGPMVAAHRSIRSAKILNKGDHAELEVRFRGKRPPFQVTAEGSTLYVFLP